MIIVALKGGLGNQLFQYACARALSLRNGEPVKFDVSGYERTKGTDTPRQYLLHHFNIHGEAIATDAEIRRFKYPYGMASKGVRFIRAKVFRKFYTNFDPRILEMSGGVYLDGFFQSELYFKEYADAIRPELTLKEPLGRESKSIADRIQQRKAVSLHVRRGDVARDRATNPYADICTPEYYERALERMEKEIGNTFRVFVFSDGMDWTKANIKIPYPVTYIPENIPEWEALTLMSMCDHHIIANSSFSWWGAWLDPKKDKVVVAPKRWIRKHAFRHRDIVPKEWIRV